MQDDLDLWRPGAMIRVNGGQDLWSVVRIYGRWSGSMVGAVVRVCKATDGTRARTYVRVWGRRSVDVDGEDVCKQGECYVIT